MNETAASQVSSSSSSSGEPPVVLRGTGRGLEIFVDQTAPLYSVLADLEGRIAQSPEFFAGNEVTLHLGGRSLPQGGLAHLKAVTDRYGMRIVCLETERPDLLQAATHLQIPVAAPSAHEPEAVELLDEPVGGGRFIIGPLRSGAVISTHQHLVVIGDVNPGAELRAGGNIIVLGTLRGLTHAACGGDAGYIIALRLEAQQIRIGPLIARAGDGAAKAGAEIAYAEGGRIIVEPYPGKLPSGYGVAKR